MWLPQEAKNNIYTLATEVLFKYFVTLGISLHVKSHTF